MSSSILEQMIRQEGMELNRLLMPKGVKVISAAPAGRYVVYQVMVAKQAKVEELAKMQKTIEGQAGQWRTRWGLPFEPVLVQVNEAMLTLRLPMFAHPAAEIPTWHMVASEMAKLELGLDQWDMVLGMGAGADHPTENEDAPLVINLASEKSWNLLVTGTSGFGKTSLLKSAVMEFMNRHGPDDVLVVIIDLENKTWGDFAGAPHLWHHATTMLQAIEALKAVLRRFKEPTDGWDKRILLIVEEVQSFTLAAPDSHARKLFMTLLSDVMTRGRAWGIHPILTTQQPNRSVIPTMVRDQFVVRVSMRQDSQEACKMALRAGYHEPMGLRNPGDFVVLATALWGPGVVNGYGYLPYGVKDAVKRWQERWPESNEVHVIDNRYRKGIDAELLRLLEEFDTGKGMRRGWLQATTMRIAYKMGYSHNRGNNYYIFKPIVEKARDVYFREAPPESLPEEAKDTPGPGDLALHSEPVQDYLEERLVNPTKGDVQKVGWLRFAKEK